MMFDDGWPSKATCTLWPWLWIERFSATGRSLNMRIFTSLASAQVHEADEGAASLPSSMHQLTIKLSVLWASCCGNGRISFDQSFAIVAAAVPSVSVKSSANETSMV